MTVRHWMQIAALTSALGLTGAAIAQNTEGTTSTGDRATTSGSDMDSPSAGALVTPEDKALGMGQGKAGSGVLNGDADQNESTPNDDELNVDPGPSNDDEFSVSPGPSKDDRLTVTPPPSRGSDTNPSGTGRKSVRGD
ncbi:MAG TPA: hypothetical protein VJV77_16355 [Casimicrobiaceae bacterium]|nr:hypothetical protein [Casimicrobiaceae bacterium]